jgi:hypothetical protein
MSQIPLHQSEVFIIVQDGLFNKIFTVRKLNNILFMYSIFKNRSFQALVAHACNPSYSGGSLFEASPGK